MSIAQTYFLAHKARAKLSSEAAKPDHNLRLLVGHANLLDSLMLELADAEREQESWFNHSVRGASHGSSTGEDRHIQWADTIVEEPEHDWRAEDVGSDSDSDSDDSDSDSDFDDEDVEMADAVPLRRIPSHGSMLPLYRTGYAEHDYDMDNQGGSEEEEEEDDEDDEDFTHLALHRTPSHASPMTAATSPPELDDDSDESTEDEAMPPTPPTTVLPTFEEPQKGGDDTTAAGAPSETEPTPDPADKTALFEEGYYLPPRNPASLMSTISVF